MLHSSAPNSPARAVPATTRAPRTRWLFSALAVGALLTIALLAAARSSIRHYMLQQAIPVDYFEPELERPDELEAIAGPLLAFRHGINRSLILDTPRGLAVFDTFNPEHAERMRQQLRRRFGDRDVRWVFYSHAHLDHIGGAAVLHPEEVIAHRDVMARIRDFPAGALALPVTREIEGDQRLELGGVAVQLIDLGHSHSESLYAFYFPAQRTLYAPDSAFVRTLPPFGLPDHYFPGYVRALDRLVELDFDRCVPAHFGLGTKADLVDYRQMMIDFREAAVTLVNDMGGDPSRGAGQRARIGAAYDALREKYGAWHGFESMFIPHFLGAIGGVYVGY